MPRRSILPGAEPISHLGSRDGVLLLHGFAGSPWSLRPIAGALIAAGYSVEAPLLAGHGTHIDDMLSAGWDDWTTQARDALRRLAGWTHRRVVVGSSMGGSLTLWLAAEAHAGRLDPATVDAVVCINPKVVPDPTEVRDLVVDMVAEGDMLIPGSGSDIAKADVVDVGYSGLLLPPWLSVWDGLDALGPKLGGCRQPMLLMTSPNDHVVPPSDSDHLAAVWGGSIERVSLDNSYHVATLDHDAELLVSRTAEFIVRVLGHDRPRL